MRSIRWFILAVLLVLLSGCKGNQQADEFALEVWGNLAKWDAYAFESTFDVQLNNVKWEQPGMDPLLQLFLQTVQAVTLRVEGRHQGEPLRNEYQLAVEVPQLGIALDFPMLAADHKLVFQLPDIPFYPLDAKLKQKWIEITPEQLPAVMQPYGQYLLLSKKDRERLSTAGMELFLDQFGDDDYLQWVEQSDAELPDDIDADRVLMWQMEEDHKAEVLKAVRRNLLPQWEELLLQPRWLEALSLTEDTGKQWREQWEQWATQAETLQRLTVLLAVDEQKRPVYRLVSVHLQGDQTDGSGSAAVQMETRWHDWDAANSLEMDGWEIEQTVPLDEWLEQIP